VLFGCCSIIVVAWLLLASLHLSILEQQQKQPTLWQTSKKQARKEVEMTKTHTTPSMKIRSTTNGGAGGHHGSAKTTTTINQSLSPSVQDQVPVGSSEILDSPHVSSGPGQIAHAPVPSVFVS
jgi:hypothetical protein